MACRGQNFGKAAVQCEPQSLDGGPAPQPAKTGGCILTPMRNAKRNFFSRAGKVVGFTAMQEQTVRKPNARISNSALAEVQAALKEYWTTLDDSELSEASKGIYTDQAENFVRWLKGDFNPGSRKEPYPIRKGKKDSAAS